LCVVCEINSPVVQRESCWRLCVSVCVHAYKRSNTEKILQRHRTHLTKA